MSVLPVVRRGETATSRSLESSVVETAPVRVGWDGTSKWSERAFAWMPLLILSPLSIASWRWAAAHGLPMAFSMNWLVLGEVGFLCCTLMHECGHMVCGWLSEFRLTIFEVGPFHFKKRAGAWRFQFQPAAMLTMGGLCGMIPNHPRRAITRAMFLTAGGPVGSLLTALVGTMAFLSCPHTAWAPAWPLFETLMLMGWIQFLSSLIPLHAGAHYTDGARLIQYTRPGWSDQLLARATVALSLQTELRPRDWNTELIEVAANFDNGPQERLPFLLFAYVMRAERGQYGEAARWMRLAIELCADSQLPWANEFASHFALHEAYERGDAAAARQWLNRAKAEDSTDWHLAEAAVLYLEGEAEGALKAWEAAEVAVRKVPRTGAYAREREQVEEMGARWFAERPAELKVAA